MIIILRTEAADTDIRAVEQKISDMGLEPHVSKGIQRIVIGAIGDETKVDKELLEALPCVENVVRVMKPYKIVSRDSHHENTIIDVGGVKIGGKTIQVIAGPC